MTDRSNGNAASPAVVALRRVEGGCRRFPDARAVRQKGCSRTRSQGRGSWRLDIEAHYDLRKPWHWWRRPPLQMYG